MIHDLPSLHYAYLDGLAGEDSPTPDEHRAFLRDVCRWRGVGDGLAEYLLHHGRLPDLGGWAIKYARQGWRVFPVCERGKEPHPAAGSWLRTATADEATIKAWWATHPTANVGLVCGGKLGVCLDVDRTEALDELPEKLPPTLCASTGSGGLHMFFAGAREYTNRTGGLPRGIDVRGDRGYIVAPPSVHPGGGIYHWLTRRRPVPMPGWLEELLAVEEVAPVPRTLPPVDRPDVVERARRYLRAMPGAVSGQGGHAQTFLAAQVLVRGFRLDEGVAYSLLCEWNRSCDPPWGEKALRHKVSSAAKSGSMAWGKMLED